MMGVRRKRGGRWKNGDGRIRLASYCIMELLIQVWILIENKGVYLVRWECIFRFASECGHGAGVYLKFRELLRVFLNRLFGGKTRRLDKTLNAYETPCDNKANTLTNGLLQPTLSRILGVIFCECYAKDIVQRSYHPDKPKIPKLVRSIMSVTGTNTIGSQAGKTTASPVRNTSRNSFGASKKPHTT